MPPTIPSRRLAREARTVETMIRRWCRKHHGGRHNLCEECEALLDYAHLRLSLCPFQEGKPTCGNCRVHCYKPAMREKIREVMRYMGPRMILTNPVMAIQHLLDSRRKEPER